MQDEPRFLKRLMKVMYPHLTYDIYSYSTTIHTLAAKLTKDYPDFDNGESDIRLILREMEQDPDKQQILNGTFTDIILAFDFDPHHDNPNFDTVTRMLAYFIDSTDMGKLYINYPMMQSYRHMKSLPDFEYISRKATPHNYKELVAKESTIGDLAKYDFNTFMQIAILNSIKVWRIIHRQNKFPFRDEFLSIDWVKLYQIELNMFWENDISDVVNSLVLYIYDYSPTWFSTTVIKHFTWMLNRL